jgi:hypothetical protein
MPRDSPLLRPQCGKTPHHQTAIVWPKPGAGAVSLKLGDLAKKTWRFGQKGTYLACPPNNPN